MSFQTQHKLVTKAKKARQDSRRYSYAGPVIFDELKSYYSKDNETGMLRIFKAKKV